MTAMDKAVIADKAETNPVHQLLTDNIDLWTSAIEQKKSTGRGSNRKQHLYGIKKLRELILELAVRGKLVPQDPNDEPASELLKRIAAERDQLVKNEGLKTKAKGKVEESDFYIDIPQSWSGERLGNLAKFIDYRGKTPQKISSGVPLITAKNIRFGYISQEPEEFISASDYESWMTRGFPRVGDLLFTTEAPLGNVAIIEYEEKFALAQRAICLQLHEPKLSRFLMYLIMSPIFRLQLEDNATGMTAKGIKSSNLKELLILIPPIEEQARIVAKVDELMALCDQLEQQTEQQLDAHQCLVDTLLDTLVQSQNAQELADNWVRLSEHFDTLFTTEASIDQLKQTILQLAVMGKLVPQNPDDEPASELIRRIAEEKAQLIKEKKIKKQKALPPIRDEEKPFELPEGWEWCRLDELSLHSEAGWSPRCEGAPREGDSWGVLKVSAVTWSHFQADENKALPDSLEPRPQYEVKPGDFLISRANTAELVAKAVVVPDSCPSHLMMSDKIIRFQFSEKAYVEFINLVNNSSFSRSYYAKVAGGTSSSMKNVSRAQVQNLLIPLPCLLEQHRIVAKVNDLFALCDQLKTHVQQNQQTQLLLTDTLVQEALS